MVDGPVLIVGCGVFGLSTALEAVKQGKFVYILDKYEPPSPWSAANDFNKIIRCEYNDEMYAKMAIEALHLWRSDPLFKKSFNECGRILISPMNHKGRLEFERKGIETLRSLNEGLKYEFYKGGLEIGNKFEGFKDNDVPSNQEVKYNPEGGLGLAAQTIKDVYEYLLSHHRVRFVFGESGDVVSVKRYSNGEVGIVTASGYTHSASTVILAMGANSGSVLNLENQQSATGAFVTHIQLTDEEFDIYKNIPVLFDAEIGYFFPPDPLTKIMKLCLTGRGIKRSINDPFNSNTQISLPRYHNENPTDTIPEELVDDFRQLLNKYAPSLKSHNLFGSRVCWYGDTEKSHFLIDKVPGFTNLYIATGDSGHGYKFFPNIGKYIIQMVDDNLESDMKENWKWTSRLNDKMVDPAAASWRVTKNTTRDITDINFLKETVPYKL